MFSFHFMLWKSFQLRLELSNFNFDFPTSRWYQPNYPTKFEADYKLSPYQNCSYNKYSILGIFWYIKNKVAISSMMCTQDFDLFLFETLKNFSSSHKTGSVSNSKSEFGSRVSGTPLVRTAIFLYNLVLLATNPCREIEFKVSLSILGRIYYYVIAHFIT